MTDRFVALIRHGAYHQRPDTPSALQPYPLTEGGRVQAQACGDTLVRILDENGWALDEAAWSSPQLRAWETAQLALSRLSHAGHEASVTQTPALSERSVGSAANLTLSEIEEVLNADPRFEAPPPGWKSNSDYQLPLHGAESLMMAGARVADHLRQITSGPAPARPTLTLCFGHGASFRHAAFHLGVLTRDRIAQLSMYHARPLLLCYNAQGTWRHCGGSWKVRGRKDIPLD